jgi:hypothetical protein
MLAFCHPSDGHLHLAVHYVSAYPGGQAPAGYVPAPPPGAYGGECKSLRLIHI